MALVDKRKRRLFSLIFIIYPFLFIVGIIDFIISLFLPHKYEDDALPDKNTKLSIRVEDGSSDNNAVFRSSLVSDLQKIENPDTNLYEELKAIINKFHNRKTFGVREIFSIGLFNISHYLFNFI